MFWFEPYAELWIDVSSSSKVVISWSLLGISLLGFSDMCISMPSQGIFLYPIVVNISRTLGTVKTARISRMMMRYSQIHSGYSYT